MAPGSLLLLLLLLSGASTGRSQALPGFLEPQPRAGEAALSLGDEAICISTLSERSLGRRPAGSSEATGHRPWRRAGGQQVE